MFDKLSNEPMIHDFGRNWSENEFFYFFGISRTKPPKTGREENSSKFFLADFEKPISPEFFSFYAESENIFWFSKKNFLVEKKIFFPKFFFSYVGAT
jgi:hypothetical protein